MRQDPCRVFIVSDIREVAVSSDPSEGSMITLKVREGADLSLWLTFQSMAKLQALLAKADMKHAKSVQPQ